jgi:ABC-type transport system involved in cytochrome c biogenesis ATPase subunit
VTFSYSAEQPLFEGLDMVIPGGKTTAIVGATGSGKTTILSLMSRLYNVEGGTVTIGDTPINDIRIRVLRSAFSVVAQDIVIFNNSIWENIKYVNPDATDDEIWEAAEAAEIADLIRARGDAPLGPKGSQLSGGQKQRIAIARAFLRALPPSCCWTRRPRRWIKDRGQGKARAVPPVVRKDDDHRGAPAVCRDLGRQYLCARCRAGRRGRQPCPADGKARTLCRDVRGAEGRLRVTVRFRGRV